MIVYNTTIKIDPQIEKEWIHWQKNEHIPETLSTGLFTDHKFFRLLDQDETEGITYVIQYFSASMNEYKKFVEEFAPQLQKSNFDKWKDQFVAFNTVMQIVN